MVQPETPKTLLGYFRGFVNLVWQSPFILFSIITSVIISMGGHPFLIEFYANPISHFVAALTLVELGYFSANRTLTNFLKSEPEELKYKATLVIIPSFIILCLITDIVYFAISTWAPFVPEFQDEQKQEQLKSVLSSAQICSLGTAGSTIVFFYGNRIMRNIRKRDLEPSAS